MKPQQRSEGKQQSDNGGKELGLASARAGAAGSNEAAGAMPANPAGHYLAADQKMDDDTGLSNTANRAAAELDPNLRQERQSNVGRRSDGTPDQACAPARLPQLAAACRRCRRDAIFFPECIQRSAPVRGERVY
jgi:hypothetical protein